MTIITSEQELEAMTQRAEADITAGRVHTLKEVYEELYRKREENVGVV